MKPSHHRIIPNWLLLVFAIVLVGALGYLTWFYCVKPESTETATTPVAITNSNSTASINWKTYTNDQLGITFKYPQDWNDLSLNKYGPKNTPSDKGTVYSSSYPLINNQPTYYDPDKAFDLSIYSNDFMTFPMGPPSPMAVDLNWSKKQFQENMDSFNIMGYKKLGNNALLTIEHSDYECSPFFLTQIYIPLKNKTYPNLIIGINNPNIEKDPIITNLSQEQKAAGKDVCDTAFAYQKIADKIMAGTYSEKMNNQIKIAQLIADSLISNSK